MPNIKKAELPRRVSCIMEKAMGGLVIIKENCEQRGWCHMPSSRKVEKRIEE